MGYARAGFEVVGIDIKYQRHYPFKQLTMDALDIFQPQHRTWLSQFAAIHASPPCQRFSDATGTSQRDPRYPDLLAPTRELLKHQRQSVPYVIENVRGAPLHRPVMICGTERGGIIKADNGQLYRLRRHRYFETNWALISPGCRCSRYKHIPVMDTTGGGNRQSTRAGQPRRTYRGGAEDRRRIMGVEWGARHEVKDAVPPAYTELIGRQLRFVAEHWRDK